ncbi:TniB family NTP-binding protein [Sphingobium yanoikuyae]|jgi:hypothetical protein|uniref:TniB family NTP-binding protein n=1 Tax=Sphingobium yanoikuyae TaxID=13690 RepID=UPI00241F27F6|nr:TniB family NTP-binding protein [Sphingobium yanoikuyae]
MTLNNLNQTAQDADEDFREDPDHDVNQIVEAAAQPATASDRLRRLKLLAERRLLVRGIMLPYAPQQELHDACDEALYAAEALREANLPQPMVQLLADSFSGKTAGIKAYIADVFARAEHTEGTTPVAYAKIDTDGTVGSLAADILRALGERRPTSLSPDKRWERARQAIRDHGVRLFIFDECQRAGRRPTISPVIGGKILDIMDGDGTVGGDCACVFLGKTSASNFFDACPDLKNRQDTPVLMPRLRWTTDKDDFMKFADAFDQALVDGGVTKFKSGLGDEEIAQLLLEASNGLIGQFSRIIETAVIMITRDGNDAITRTDLRDAVQDWSIGNGRIGYNPFDKAQEEKPAKKKTSKKAKAEAQAESDQEEDADEGMSSDLDDDDSVHPFGDGGFDEGDDEDGQ